MIISGDRGKLTQLTALKIDDYDHQPPKSEYPGAAAATVGRGDRAEGYTLPVHYAEVVQAAIESVGAKVVF
ncbi:MAG: hypothetical protein KME45_04035 [Stenomitos rutilans HA7619-LM2]|jgi:hypothetical protein|nr:hypothetical protein [Stenomitos rutilans HA7619-LM2]